MPLVDPISELKRQAGAELARAVEGWNGDDVGALLRTDRSRIADLRRCRLDRFSLETLIRFLTRLGLRVELRITRAPPLRRLARRANGVKGASDGGGSSADDRSGAQ